MSPRALIPLIACALSTTLHAGCTPRTVRVPVPVVITPPPCVTRPPPVAAADVPVFGQAWVDYYQALLAWSWGTWRACRPAVEASAPAGGEP